MTAQNYDEKRGFFRMQIETPVMFKIKGQADITHHGLSHDLSATGLLMSSDFAPQHNDELEIIIDSQSERFSPFTAEGKVLRVEADPTDPCRYQISVELLLQEEA